MSRHRFGAAWVLGLALVGLAGIVPAEAATPVQVSEGPELSWASTGAVVGTGASLYVVYVAPADAGYGPVRLRRSKDGGATFLPSILVNDAGTTDNHSASVAAAGSASMSFGSSVPAPRNAPGFAPREMAAQPGPRACPSRHPA